MKLSMDDPTLVRPGPLPRDPAALDEPAMRVERLLRLDGARPVIVNHALLRQDFARLRPEAWLAREPALRRLDPLERERRIRQKTEDWLVRQAAWISRSQAAQTRTNTPIRTTEETRPAWRPPRYGRAAVVRTDDGHGLLDLKGVGVPSWGRPRMITHSTGLLFLAEAFRSMLLFGLFNQIFAATGSRFATVPIYGALDAGFDARHPHFDGAFPAGILVRRAHRRPRGGVELPLSGERREAIKFEVEMLLRSYGMTSANHFTHIHVERVESRTRFRYYDIVHDGLSATERARLESAIGPPPARVEGVNVQLIREIDRPDGVAQIVDMGQYEWRSGFDLGIASLVRDRPVRFGGLLKVDDPAFVQPDPRLHLPEDDWSQDHMPPQMHALAASLRDGTLDRETLLADLERRIGAAVARWIASDPPR